MLKVGVVGLGRGMSLLRTFALHDDTRVVAVCDMNQERAVSVKEEMKLDKAYSDYSEFLEHDMDIVAVATPLPFHAENSIAALESHKHVLCEVPIVNSIEEGEALVKAVKKSKSKFMFAENCNYWHFVKKWREIVSEGRLGKPTYAEAEYVHDCRSIMRHADGTPTWRTQMPPIYYSTHSLGPILSILDDKCVTAVGMNTGVNVAPDLGAIDMGVGLFQTEKGAIIKLLCGFSVERKPAFHFYSIYGTGGCLESVRGTSKFAAYLKDEGTDGMTELPYGTDYPDAPEYATVGGHGTCEYFMIKAFVESILNDTEPPIDVYTGLDYSLPGLCAHLSAEQGGKVVDIPDFR